MDIKKIKAEVAHIPHVKQVWVKDGEVFIHPRKGAKVIDLTKADEPEVKPVKGKKSDDNF